MIWRDMFNSLPNENAPLLMMVKDNEGNKYYSHATHKCGMIYHQTKDGEVETFTALDVYGKEHIYYIYVNDIHLLDNPSMIGDLLLKDKQEAIAILTHMRFNDTGFPGYEGWLNLMPRDLSIDEKESLDNINRILDAWQEKKYRKYVACDTDGEMRCYMILYQGKNSRGNFVYDDMRNVYYTMCYLSDNGTENLTLLACDHDISNDCSQWAIAFYPFQHFTND